MILVWIYLIASVIIFVMAVYNQILYLRGQRDAGFANGAAAPKWLWLSVSCFGLLGILSSAPGAIFHQPTWLIDKVFWLISKL